MLNFVLCDDNQDAVNRLSKMLDSILLKNNYEGQVTYSTTSSNDLLDYLKNNSADVAILDIELHDNLTAGLKVAEQIREQNKHIYIIFITAHLEYVLVAYGYKTFDYIPKPVTQQRLELTINRLYNDATAPSTKYLRLNNNKTIIPEDSITYIQKDGMKLVFHTDSRDYTVYNSFNKVSEKLPKHFVRCHKSYMVNMHRISNIDVSDNMINLENNDTCYIGPKYKNNFMEVFSNGPFTNNLDRFNNT